MRPALVVLMTFALAAAAAMVQAQSPNEGELYGTTYASEREIVAGAEITLSGLDGRRTVTSGRTGEFHVPRLRAGIYTITVKHPDYHLDKAVRMIVSGPTQLNLKLIPNRTLTTEDRVAGEDPVLKLQETVQVAGTTPDVTPSASVPGMSTRVVEAEAIEEREASSFVAVMRDLPGVAVSRRGGIGSETSAYVRGGASNYALVLIDGLPANDPGGAFDFGKLLPLELGRVELTRGAASSIYGGALSGILQLTTRQADANERRLLLNAEGGSFSWNRIQLGTSGRSEVFDWNVGAIYLQTDNEVPNNAFSQLGAAASFGAKLADDTSLRVVFRGESSEVGTPGPTSLIRPDLDASDQVDRLVLGATFRHRQASTEHILRGGISRAQRLALNPEDSGPIDIEPPEGDAAELRFVVPDFAGPDGLVNDTQRVNLAYQADVERNQHLFSFGGEVEKQTGEFGTETALAGPTDVPAGFQGFPARFGQPIDGGMPERTNLAGFFQDRMVLGGSTIVTAGGRVERNGSFGTYVLPRAAFAWSHPAGLTLKASAGMGLKEPSLEQSFGGNFRVQGNPDLLPERSRTFDAGLRQSFFEGRLWAEGIVFYHEYRDQIVLGDIDLPLITSPFADLSLEERQEIRRQIRSGERDRFELDVDFDQFRPSYTNLGKTRGQGVELSFGATPFEAIRLQVDYTFVDTSVLEGNREFIEGDALPNRPRHQLSVSAQSEIGRVSLGGTLLYVGERRGEADFVTLALGLTTSEAYTRFDVRARVALGRGFESYVVAENLFDRVYEEVLGYPALGRSIRLGLRWDLSMR